MGASEMTVRQEVAEIILDEIGILDPQCREVHDYETGGCPVCEEIRALYAAWDALQAPLDALQAPPDAPTGEAVPA